LECKFDMDVAAAPEGMGFVPADIMCRNAFFTEWKGFVWCNPPWCGRKNKRPWIDLMIKHNNGIFLAPDRTSAPWWQYMATKADSIHLVHGKIKFIPGPGNESDGEHPGNGTTLFAFGEKAIQALLQAQENKLGTTFFKHNL
jgi:DNA N-6-adenine-methyltransferase Dam